ISHIAPPGRGGLPAGRRPPFADFIVMGGVRFLRVLHQLTAMATRLSRAGPGLVICDCSAGGGRLSQISCRDSPHFVTELIRINVRSIKYGALDETGIASPITRPGLDQSAVLVVGNADAGQRREHRGLVSALPATPYRKLDQCT